MHIHSYIYSSVLPSLPVSYTPAMYIQSYIDSSVLPFLPVTYTPVMFIHSYIDSLPSRIIYSYYVYSFINWFLCPSRILYSYYVYSFIHWCLCPSLPSRILYSYYVYSFIHWFLCPVLPFLPVSYTPAMYIHSYIDSSVLPLSWTVSYTPAMYIYESSNYTDHYTMINHLYSGLLALSYQYLQYVLCIHTSGHL